MDKHIFFAFAIFSALVSVSAAHGQNTPQFGKVADKLLKKEYNTSLLDRCPIDTDTVAARVFRDYGAIYVSRNAGQPPRCVFESEAEVQAFQQSTPSETKTIGGVSVTLQKYAMTDLLAAVQEAAKKGVAITPRGGSEASTRSYRKTADLWKSRFEPALSVYVANGSIKPADADKVRRMAIHDQVTAVLNWEKKGLWFSTDRTKSILYSVAAPGASQHIFMLALDVAQFASPAVRQIMAKHGWFQTVKSDLPHFTYLGREAEELPSLGLRSESVGGQEFWVPNID